MLCLVPRGVAVSITTCCSFATGLLEQGLVESVQTSRSRTISTTLVERKLSPDGSQTDSFLEVCYSSAVSSSGDNSESSQKDGDADDRSRQSEDHRNESCGQTGQLESPEKWNRADNKARNDDEIKVVAIDDVMLDKTTYSIP